MSKQATKWTAGPWHAGPLSNDGAQRTLPKDYWNIYMPANAAALIVGSNQEANARLIAQAPAMAELLHRLSDARENGFDNYNGLIDTAERILAELAEIEGQ